MARNEQTELFATLSVIFEDGVEVKVLFYGNDGRIFTQVQNDGIPDLRRLAGVAGAFGRAVFQLIRSRVPAAHSDILEQVVFQELMPPGRKIGSETFTDSDPF